MTFIPYCSPRNTVNVTEADCAFMEEAERVRDILRRVTIRWVPILQMIARDRDNMHWCTYSDGRCVCFIELDADETFADLKDIYEAISSHVRHLQSLNKYQGQWEDSPEPEDRLDIHWREWTFRAGDSSFVLNAGFSHSQHCHIVDDGVETIQVERKRVVCGETLTQLELQS